MQIPEKLKDYLSMLSRFEIRKQFLILFLSGVLAGFSIYSIYLTPLLIIGYCYFLKKLELARTKKNALYDGVIFGTGYFLVVYIG